MFYSGHDAFLHYIRHFHVIISNGDWVSFSLHHGPVEIYDDPSTSIIYYKEEFFFFHAFTFVRPMLYGATADRAVDPSPSLFFEEESVAERLSENFIKWTNHEEIMLGMAGISSYCNKLGKKLVKTLAGREVTLLERLDCQCLANSTIVTEDVTILNSPSCLEYNMDSTTNAYVQDTIVPVIPSPSKKIVKMECDSRKPSHSSIRVTLRARSSKRKTEMEKSFPWKD